MPAPGQQHLAADNGLWVEHGPSYKDSRDRRVAKCSEQWAEAPGGRCVTAGACWWGRAKLDRAGSVGIEPVQSIGRWSAGRVGSSEFYPDGDTSKNLRTYE